MYQRFNVNTYIVNTISLIIITFSRSQLDVGINTGRSLWLPGTCCGNLWILLHLKSGTNFNLRESAWIVEQFTASILHESVDSPPLR